MAQLENKMKQKTTILHERINKLVSPSAAHKFAANVMASKDGDTNAHTVRGSFNWYTTPEGWWYWLNIFNTLKSLGA